MQGWWGRGGGGGPKQRGGLQELWSLKQAPGALGACARPRSWNRGPGPAQTLACCLFPPCPRSQGLNPLCWVTAEREKRMYDPRAAKGHPAHPQCGAEGRREGGIGVSTRADTERRVNGMVHLDTISHQVAAGDRRPGRDCTTKGCLLGAPGVPPPYPITPWAETVSPDPGPGQAQTGAM